MHKLITPIVSMAILIHRHLEIHSRFCYLTFYAGLAGVYAHSHDHHYTVTFSASLFPFPLMLVEPHLEVSLAVVPAVVLTPRSLHHN